MKNRQKWLKNRHFLDIYRHLFGTEAGFWPEITENRHFFDHFFGQKCTFLVPIFSPSQIPTNTGHPGNEDAGSPFPGPKWVRKGCKMTLF